MKKKQKASQRQPSARERQRHVPANSDTSDRPCKYQRLGIALAALALIGGGVWFVFHQFRFTQQKSLERQSLTTAGESSNLSREFAVPVASATSVSNLNERTATLRREGGAAELNTQGNNLLSKGDDQGAILAFQKAVALTPDDEDLHYNLGLAYAQAGQMTNAENEYREALRLLPGYPEVHNNLGNLLLHSGRLEEAEKEFLEALKLMPDYAKAHNNLGIIREKQKRLDEALACFQKAVLYETNYWQAHFNLANAYLARSNLDQAIPELKETLRINPSFQTAQRALDKLAGGLPSTSR